MKKIQIVVASVLACVAATGSAQTYPDKAIRVVVPWPPGGGTDIFARAIGEKLSRSMGQQIFVDNRPGASGNIGAELVAKAAPNGYTLLLATITLATSPSLYKSLGYDPLRDLEPIALIAGVPHLLVVHPALPTATVRELIALAKRRPGELNYASAGTGSPFHLAAELFSLLAAVRLSHVPYKGGNPAVIDVIGGQVQLTFANIVAVVPHVHSGKLRALGVTSAKRSVALPNVPTIAEAGVPHYEFTSWFGMLAPAATPQPIVQKLNTEIGNSLRTADLKQRMLRDGADIIVGSPEAFGAYLESETAKWVKVIREAGIAAE